MKIFFTLLLILGNYVTSYAQMPNPVHWTLCVKKLANNEAEIIMTAKIDKGYHLWSSNPGNADLIPTAFTFKQAGFYETIGAVREEGKVIKEDLSSIDLGIVNYYENSVRFIQKIKLKSKGNIEVKIEYQTCSHEGCLPPRTDDFKVQTDQSCKASLSPNKSLEQKQARENYFAVNKSTSLPKQEGLIETFNSKFVLLNRKNKEVFIIEKTRIV